MHLRYSVGTPHHAPAIPLQTSTNARCPRVPFGPCHSQGMSAHLPQLAETFPPPEPRHLLTANPGNKSFFARSLCTLHVLLSDIWPSAYAAKKPSIQPIKQPHREDT